MLDESSEYLMTLRVRIYLGAMKYGHVCWCGVSVNALHVVVWASKCTCTCHRRYCQIRIVEGEMSCAMSAAVHVLVPMV